MPAERPVYITTPIYYVNDRPHIGHAYTTTVCDVYARFQRFMGREVFFLTGTDEHGQKVEKSARERGVTPQQLADENAAEFQHVLSVFGLTNDDFIRTTQPRHERQVQNFFRQLLASGDVYLGNFEGWYDEGQEEYYTDTRAKELNYKSPISGRPLTRAQEQNYYFRLSQHQRAIEDHLAAHPDFVQPEARRNEVLGRLRDGIQDVPISRTNFTWGISVPGDEKHVIYVWIDALFNYITALGLAEPDSAEFKSRGKFWPATYHVIGKEILWFHAVIWPALLIALKLPLPRCVYAHSFWISEGQKMSKTLGNFIDLPTIQRYHATYGLDAWRYYMATQGPLGAQDADFSASHFHEVYTTDLVNTVGNCASRVTAMIIKYCDGTIPPPPPGEAHGMGGRAATTLASGAQGGTRPRSKGDVGVRGAPAIEPSPVDAFSSFNWPQLAADHVARSTEAMEAFDLSEAIGAAIALIRRIDAYINATEPFKLAKDASKKDELGAILSYCAEALRIASLLLWPVMPTKVAELWAALGLSIDPSKGELPQLATWGRLTPGTHVRKVALFPRVEQPMVSRGAHSDQHP